MLNGASAAIHDEIAATAIANSAAQHQAHAGSGVEMNSTCVAATLGTLRRAAEFAPDIRRYCRHRVEIVHAEIARIDLDLPIALNEIDDVHDRHRVDQRRREKQVVRSNGRDSVDRQRLKLIRQLRAKVGFVHSIRFSSSAEILVVMAPLHEH